MSKSRGRGVSGRTHTQAQINNYANQHNPNNNAYIQIMVNMLVMAMTMNRF